MEETSDVRILRDGRAAMVDAGGKRQDDEEKASMKQINRHDITGIIRVGEKSRRMGRDKAFFADCRQDPLRRGVGDIQRKL